MDTSDRVMRELYEVFDNEEVHRLSRRQAAQLTGAASTAVALTLLGIALGLTDRLPMPAVGGGLGVIWVGTVGWIARRLRRLRRIVWCVKLSESGVEGYDYARRKITLDWSDVRRVDLADKGLMIVGPELCFFEIPYLFRDFASLSHRIVHHAERHGAPIYIDGVPWQDLDIYHLFPMLADDPSGPRPGSAV